MIKTLKNLLKQDKERYSVPRKVQDIIPIQRIWKDGIFQVGNRFSKTYKFTDISYLFLLYTSGEEYTEENAGFKAHFVSYILGKEFGVDVNGYAFEAPADFLRTDDPQTIRAELSEIRDTAYDIFASMARSLAQNKAPRHTEQER